MVTSTCCASHNPNNSADDQQRTFIAEYRILKLIGCGSYSEVFTCRKRGSRQRQAVKIIKKRDISAYQRQLISNEVTILRSMQHPNIIRLLDEFSEPEVNYLIFELADHIDLCASLVTQSDYSEVVIKEVAKQLFTGIDYMQQHRVVHRDLKLENLLLKNFGDLKDQDQRHPKWRLKIADFGYAVQLSDAQPHIAANNCIIGSCEYIAPEMMGSKIYNELVDCWAAGVIIYFLFMGQFPFNGDSINAMLKSIRYLRVGIPPTSQSWQRLSHNAVAFLKSLFVLANERPDAASVLQHAWFTDPPNAKQNRPLIDTLPILLQRDRMEFLKGECHRISINSDNNSGSDDFGLTFSWERWRLFTGENGKRMRSRSLTEPRTMHPWLITSDLIESD